MPALKFAGKNLLGFVSAGHACQIGVVFALGGSDEPAPTIRLKTIGKHPAEELPLFSSANGSQVCGQVVLKPTHLSQRVDHQGIRVQLTGVIELAHAGVKNHEFLCLSRELAPAGEFHEETHLDFAFNNVDLSLDSYRGASVRLRYFLRVTMARGIGGASEDFPLWVQNPATSVPVEEPIKLEVGIENCLHLEFTYSSSLYGIADCVTGGVHFKLVKISLKTMELEVRRKEITIGAKTSPDVQTLYKYEIMDGAPVRGEFLPVRLYLGPLELSPTYENVQNKFSVKYFLNLVLVDSEDRRYFKQHEITLVRRCAGAAVAVDVSGPLGNAPADAGGDDDES